MWKAVEDFMYSTPMPMAYGVAAFCMVGAISLLVRACVNYENDHNVRASTQLFLFTISVGLSIMFINVGNVANERMKDTNFQTIELLQDRVDQLARNLR